MVKIKKKLKFLCHYPTIRDRDSNSMDMKTSKYFPSLSFMAVFLTLPFIGCLSIQAKEVRKNCYLSFHAPPKLHFHETAPQADRFNLLTLGEPVSSNVSALDVEENATNLVNEFPLTSYDESNVDPLVNKISGDENLLPPSDPFVDYEIGGSQVDSTDQLIQLFENMQKSGNPSSRVNVNFIPPYSTDSGNFRIESTASYKRRSR
jgi:hypothetical protein